MTRYLLPVEARLMDEYPDCIVTVEGLRAIEAGPIRTWAHGAGSYRLVVVEDEGAPADFDGKTVGITVQGHYDEWGNCLRRTVMSRRIWDTVP